ncbi:MAG TPA: hypothetical protein VGN64_06135, partial [Dyadobacter sp.]|nr:hypothetical protein [Dyadobacter sp.]
MAENVILDILFDEADGSTIAYDLSPGHHHAAIELGRFVPGRFGNCVYFPNEGKAEIIEQVIDFSQDFTFMIWVMAVGYGNKPTNSYVLFKFPGSYGFFKVLLNTRMSNWTHVTITQEADLLTVYVNGTRMGICSHPSGLDPTGFAILNDSPHSTGGFCYLDGGKTIGGQAIPPEEIIDIIQNTLQVEFSVANVNFRDFGVVVEKIDGVFNKPALKDPLTMDWGDYHGEVVDLIKHVVGVREISLRCWLKGANQDDFISKWMEFKSRFEQGGPIRIQIDAGTKPLLFEVYHREDLDIEKEKWRTGVNFGRFTLKLREPEPVKKVLKVNGSSCT